MDYGIAETGIARGSPPGTTTEVLRFGIPFAEIRVVSINMETEAFIIKYIKQPSQLRAKHVYANKHHVENKMQCMQINKYDHEHDSGKKRKLYLD
jgi:hypothetical protein